MSDLPKIAVDSQPSLGEPSITLRGVTVRRGRKTILDSVDLSVDNGQACAIVGTNGSGKSTLLRVVAALCRPQGGQVWIGRWNAVRFPERVRALIGYVAEADGLADQLTPTEHLEMVATHHGLGRADRRAATESMLELVDLTRHAQSPITALSHGQRRRLAVALALVHDPPLILLDEPFVGVDEVGRGELASILLELRSMGKTLLIASQSHAEIADVTDIVAWLADGQIRSEPHYQPQTLTWLEIIGDTNSASLALREYPWISDIRQDGTFFTLAGLDTPDDRSRIAEWLIARGIHLAGFGTTTAAADGTSP